MIILIIFKIVIIIDKFERVFVVMGWYDWIVVYCL